MTTFVEFAAVPVEVLLGVYIYEGLFAEHRHPYAAFIYYAVWFVVGELETFYLPIPWLRSLILFLIALVGNYVTYRTKPLPCLYNTALYFLVIVFSDVLCAAILTAAGYGTKIAMGGSERIALIVMARTVNLLLIQILLLIFRRDKPRAFPLISVPLFICQILSFFACYRSFFALGNGENSGTILFTTLSLMVVNIIICFYVRILEDYYRRRAADAAAESLAELQRQYFENMTSRQEETRALWHDIKKYVSAMETMVASDKTDEAQKCFAEIREKYEKINKSVDVGNTVVDSILSDAVRRAGDAGIDLRLNVWVAPELNIPPADLYIIIGNTLDNAFAACEKFPKGKRVIELLLRQSNHLLYYELKNPYLPGEPPKKGGIHGYGLRNVRACVEKNKGAIDVNTDDNFFTISVQLNV